MGKKFEKFILYNGSGERYFAKVFRSNDDRWRQRFHAELNAESILKKSEYLNVPKILFWEENLRVIIFEWIDGARFTETNLTLKDFFDEALHFIAELKFISRTTQNNQSIPASDSLLDVNGFMVRLVARMEALSRLEGANPLLGEMKSFLRDDVAPLCKRQMKFLTQHLQASNSILYLDQSDRILSPSDCGTHNVLVGDKLWWVDFEFFGWDDPVKLILDIMLHPAMKKDEESRSDFLTAARSLFREDIYFDERFKCFYPIVALNWVLIVLNDFLDVKEKVSTVFKCDDNDEAISRQLSKARDYFEVSRSRFESL